MNSRIDYIEAAHVDSLGRNGRMTTIGCHLSLYHWNRQQRAAAVIMPVNSRGEVGRAEVSVDVEAAGEVGAFFVEAFARYATPEARQALLARLEAICAGQPDPARAAEEAAAAPEGHRPPAGPR